MTTPSAWPYPRWIAHRGAGKLAPENTLAAFRLGAQHGYRMFECDAKLSSDGVAFLLHDATLERTTNGHGTAGDQPWGTLAQLDAGERLFRQARALAIPLLVLGLLALGIYALWRLSRQEFAWVSGSLAAACGALLLLLAQMPGGLVPPRAPGPGDVAMLVDLPASHVAWVEQGKVPARITDLHVWRVGRAKYACVLSLDTSSQLDGEYFRRELAVHEELAHVTVEVNHVAP